MPLQEPQGTEDGISDDREEEEEEDNGDKEVEGDQEEELEEEEEEKLLEEDMEVLEEEGEEEKEEEEIEQKESTVKVSGDDNRSTLQEKEHVLSTNKDKSGQPENVGGAEGGASLEDVRQQRREAAALVGMTRVSKHGHLSLWEKIISLLPFLLIIYGCSAVSHSGRISEDPVEAAECFCDPEEGEEEAAGRDAQRTGGAKGGGWGAVV